MRAILTFFLVVTFCSVAMADVPSMINYQGTLKNSSGDPMDTTVTIVFSICNDSAATICVWGESQPDVEVVNGLFSVQLGSINPLTESVFSDENRWLHIVIGFPAGEPIDPPNKLITSAYAFHAAKADTAAYAITSGTKGSMSSSAFNSGWQTIEKGTLKEIYHNLNQDPNDLFVDIQRKSTGKGINNINEQNVGSEQSYYKNLNSISISVYRSESDECDLVRIRIWIVK